jgi:hypothetical protein
MTNPHYVPPTRVDLTAEGPMVTTCICSEHQLLAGEYKKGCPLHPCTCGNNGICTFCVLTDLEADRVSTVKERFGH